MIKRIITNKKLYRLNLRYINILIITIDINKEYYIILNLYYSCMTYLIF